MDLEQIKKLLGSKVSDDNLLKLQIAVELYSAQVSKNGFEEYYIKYAFDFAEKILEEWKKRINNGSS